MDDKNLLTFREDWVSEIHAKKRKTDDIPKQGSSSLHATKEDKHKHKNNQCPIPAFVIANDYLNPGKNCRFCVREGNSCNCTEKSCSEQNLYQKQHGSSGNKLQKQHVNSSSRVQRKHKVCAKYLFSKHGVNNSQPGIEEGNLIDLLISDIDEITCIPFFDMELPKEIAVYVFKYLTVDDLSNCCLVNSKWKVLAEDDLIWFNLGPLLGVERDVDFVAERAGWKNYVKECVLERRRIQRKWKERFCEVKDLEHEKGGIICSVSTHNDTLLAAYLDGSVKLWDLAYGSFGQNLKEQYTTDEDIVMSMCLCTCVSKHFCAAGFQNGDLMVWKIKEKISGDLIYMQNYDSSEIKQLKICLKQACICIVQPNKFTVIKSSTDYLVDWRWENVLEKNMNDKILDVLLVEDRVLKVAVCTRNELQIHSTEPVGYIVLETLIGATFSCIDYKKMFLVAAIISFGYSVLGGYRVRKYCLQSGKQVSNIIGLQVMINCLNYANCYDDKVIIGCSDNKIRIHDFKTESLLITINGVDSEVTMLQMDKWKVVSGHLNGTVCLWDCTNGSMYWQTQQKHPVRLCCFTENLLTSVNLPVDKYPKNSYWYADDLTQHRKYRGSIRVMDFTKDNYTIGVPNECHAEYDNITGYDYNIELIAPYDDVKAFNLPQI